MAATFPFILSEFLVDAATADPHRTAIIVEGQAYRYGELLDHAARLANVLRARGVERGDRVAIFMDNAFWTVAALFGVLLADGAFTVVNHQAKQERLRAVLTDCTPRFLLADGRLAHVFEPAVEGLPVEVLTTREDVPGRDRLETTAAHASAEVPPVASVPQDLAALIYTSGSTGEPKGVMMSHQAMVFTASTIARYLELRPEQKTLSVLPLSFTYGLYQLLTAVLLGSTLVLEKSFAYPGQIVQRFREEEPQVFAGVPTIYQTLIRLDRQKPIVLPSVERITNAAAALAASAVPHLAHIFPNARLYKMYGLTECTRVCYLDPSRLGDKPSSVGQAIPGTEIFLRDAEGHPVAPGEVGILHVRGPHVMLGYWGRPEATKKMLLPGNLPFDRVLRTGDWFKQDEEGLLYFVARSDDIIKTRGEKVSPVEVEHVLHSLVGVKEAAVVGVPDETQGQLIRAYVSLEPDATVTEKDVRMHCAKHLEPYMVPTEVCFEPEIPKTPSGKVYKQGLRERDGLV
ncbi:MAG: AMP-binding protein [Myxococcales bacterium]|nr:AMP-binding protein [Myxococcales bacterium]